MDAITPDLGQITFSPAAEEWIEYGPPGERRRLDFHDYAALYAEPGLYERVFCEELGMRSTEVVADLYGRALERLGRDAAAERVLDLGAGSGLGGQQLRALGVLEVVGVDREPAARRAVERDRPGVYDHYRVGDAADLAELEPFTAMLAFSAIGAGHIPLDVLSRLARDLVAPGGLVGFAVSEELRGALDRDFPDRVESIDYVHRRSVDGSEHRATAVMVQVGAG